MSRSTVLLLFSALIIGFCLPNLWQYLNPPTTLLGHTNSFNKAIPLNQYCLLSKQPCTQKNVTMTLSQDIAHPLLPIKIKVDWPEQQAPKLDLILKGYDMNMGNPRFVLHKQTTGTYLGTVILPVCTQDAMLWVGQLTDGKNIIYPALQMQSR